MAFGTLGAGFGRMGASTAGGSGGGGAVAPVLSNPTDTITGSTTATITVDTDQSAGTLYWVMSTSGTPPSAAQVKAGQDSGGGAAAAAGNQAVSASGTQSANATGLTASTAYFAYFMHENAAQSNVSGSATKTTWNTETQTWINAVVGDGGTVSTPRGQLVDNLISSLKTNSIFTKLDRLWLFAAENSQSALRDLVGANLASVVSSPTFTTDRGFTGNGSTSYVNSAFTPSTNGVQFTLNSASAFARNLTAGAASSADRLIGHAVSPTGSNRVLLLPRGAGDLVTQILNSSSSATYANTNKDGFFHINRSASNAVQAYRNATSLGTNTTASGSLSDTACAFLRDTTNFAAIQVASGGFGASLSSTDATNLYNAELTYMQAVGAA